MKRFITNGDSDDLFENIMHMVLARPEGAGPGTKGLSLFLVPKFLPDPKTGEPGERNGAFVTGLEHKMGLNASATCELTFGQHGTPAVGYLVGDTHRGIAQMFKVIEYARMMVGTKAISALSTGYLNALEYAKTRVQGADLTQMTDKTAPRVTIMHHPDVRRALMMQKSYAEGLRALYLYTAAHHDPAVAEIVSGADAEMAGRVNDLLLPIVKGVGSERAYQTLTESLQTFGGSGYLQDYPIEQYIRDAKIDSSTRAPPRSRRRTSSSARSPATAVWPWATWSARSADSSTRRVPAPNSPMAAWCWAPRSTRCRRWPGH